VSVFLEGDLSLQKGTETTSFFSEFTSSFSKRGTEILHTEEKESNFQQLAGREESSRVPRIVLDCATSCKIKKYGFDISLNVAYLSFWLFSWFHFWVPLYLSMHSRSCSSAVAIITRK